MRKFFTIAILALSINAFAQIPTNGLLGYWPFSGNANDFSGNNNNGTTYNVSLTTDRFGNSNSAYSFNGTSSYIDIPSSNHPIGDVSISYSLWFNSSNTSGDRDLISVGTPGLTNSRSCIANAYWGKMVYVVQDSGDFITNYTVPINTWHHIVFTKTGSSVKFYVDGNIVDSTNLSITQNVNDTRIVFGSTGTNWGDGEYYEGTLDDIRIYDRVLAPTEINNLFNEGTCYQTITVTDTLIINANLTGFNPITYQNSIKIYPNPTNDQITINFGSNYSTMNGYTLKITNSLSQIVYTTPINTQSTTVNLSTWTGNGIYFVHLIDASSNTIDIRKIVLQ